MLNRILAGLLLAGLTAPASPAASLPPPEIQILARALSFLDPPLAGESVVAIATRPATPTRGATPRRWPPRSAAPCASAGRC